MKKIVSIVLFLLLLISPFFPIYNVKAITLRDYYKDLEEKEAKLNRTEEEKAAIEAKIAEYNNQIIQSQEAIIKAQEDIDIAQNKIYDLNLKIEEKNEEIKALLKFKQIESGDNVYLEYIFGASDFTDFIYRSAIVEELSAYNDSLIDEMYALIEENKVLTKELEGKIAEEKQATIVFQQMLAANEIDLDDLASEATYTEADIIAKKEEIANLEKSGCGMDDDLSVCVDIPAGSAFIRPLANGAVTDEYGLREVHPVYYWTTWHYGIDIGAWYGTPIYAAATGRVAYTVEDYTPGSGGGKKVILYHLINGTAYTTTYMHLGSINVSADEFVTVNTIIGYVGSTGASTGPHLHFQIMYGHGNIDSNAFNPRELISFPPYGVSFYSRY